MHGSLSRARKSGMRPLLFVEHRSRFGPGGRWHLPGYVSDYARALEAGDPVVVSSAAMMCALLHANLLCDDFAFGGAHYGKSFHVSGDDVVTEWTAEDQAELDPEPDAHCKGGRTCFRCDPGNTGVQTVAVPRTRRTSGLVGA
jgi:hypothetical protein